MSKTVRYFYFDPQKFIYIDERILAKATQYVLRSQEKLQIPVKKIYGKNILCVSKT